VIDRDLAVRRLGLAEEEEVKSMKRLVKAVSSEAQFSKTFCGSAPSGIPRACVPWCFRSNAGEFLRPVSAGGGGRGGGFSRVLECK